MWTKWLREPKRLCECSKMRFGDDDCNPLDLTSLACFGVRYLKLLAVLEPRPVPKEAKRHPASPPRPPHTHITADPPATHGFPSLDDFVFFSFGRGASSFSFLSSFRHTVCTALLCPLSLLSHSRAEDGDPCNRSPGLHAPKEKEPVA